MIVFVVGGWGRGVQDVICFLMFFKKVNFVITNYFTQISQA